MSNDTLKHFYERYIAAANARDFEFIAGLIHEQVSINGVPHTREDSINGLRGIADAVPNFLWCIEDLVINDDRIAARLRDTGTPTKQWLGFDPSGAKVDFTEFAFYTVRD